ncbi:MAG: tyrosine-type recombinase/integrase [Bacillota bacterium]
MNTVDPLKNQNDVIDIAAYLNSKNKRNYVMFSFGIYTGLRISDILPFRVGDVKGKDFIYLREQKTRRERKIEINKELKSILNEYTEGKAAHEYLFASRKGGKPIRRETAYAILKDAAIHFKIPCIGTHTLRKTYGYHFYLLSGKDIGLTQQALGHTDPNFTLRYIGATQEAVTSISKKLSFNIKKNV